MHSKSRIEKAISQHKDEIETLAWQLALISVPQRAEMIASIISRCEWNGDCLEWQGANSGDGRGGGYGCVSYMGFKWKAHRLMYSLVNHPVPPNKQIHHKCDNRKCCNPEHLECTTNLKNQRAKK